jgi:hypothetical protein
VLYRPSNSAGNITQCTTACGLDSPRQLKASSPVSDKEFRLLNIRVPADIAQRLKERAARDYESQASLVRRLIRSGLNAERRAEVPSER